MDNAPATRIIPDWLQQTLSLVLTLAAALLYLAILGYAIIRSFVETEPVFTMGATRAAQLLSGLVGSVVTAGFARGKRLPVGPVSADHPMGGLTSTSWTRLKPPSRTSRKFMGLGELVGFRALPGAPQKSRLEEGEGEQPLVSSLSLWVGLVYFGVYFLVGIGAFALIMIKTEVPEFIGNSAWVWLGTMAAAGYSFFSLGAGEQ
jgi:hypothetical protein